MGEDFARVTMSGEIEDGAGARRVGEGAGEGVGQEGGKEGGDAGEEGVGEKHGLKSMLAVKGEGRVRKRSTVSVRILHQIYPQYPPYFFSKLKNAMQ